MGISSRWSNNDAHPDDPTQPSTYAGEVITNPSRNRREQITLLDTHPFFGAG
ncbi:MAG: hypothetical protein LVS60_03425 [Nodosilinea sp. LVE1205-7]